jgi:hypothetical protein
MAMVFKAAHHASNAPSLQLKFRFVLLVANQTPLHALAMQGTLGMDFNVYHAKRAP